MDRIERQQRQADLVGNAVFPESLSAAITVSAKKQNIRNWWSMGLANI